MNLIDSFLLSLKHAPVWVYFLFFYSMYVGMKSLAQKKVVLRDAVINLLILLFLSGSFAMNFWHDKRQLFLIIAAIVLANIPYLNKIYGVSIKNKDGEIYLAGSSRKLMLLIFLFANRYAYNTLLAQGYNYMENMLVVYAFNVTFSLAIGVLILEAWLIAYGYSKCRN